MNTHRIILSTTIAALLGAAAFATESKSSTAVTVNTTDGKGKAVITIDINGKKETREIDLGNATSIEIRTDGTVDKKKERVTYLGVAMSDVPAALADQLGLDPGSGVLVGSVVPDSPAAKAGLEKNDVLVRFGGDALKNPAQLQSLVSARKEGEKVPVDYVRRAKPGHTEVTLGSEERSADPLANLAETWKPLAGDWLKDAISKGLGVHRRAIIIGPDGKVIEQQDPAKQMREAAESVEKALRDSKVGEKTLDAVRDALEDAVKALEKARDSHADVPELRERAEQKRREMREQVEKTRREIEERVRRELNNKHPDASGQPLPDPKLEKDR